jgi:hypothetical protein
VAVLLRSFLREEHTWLLRIEAIGRTPIDFSFSSAASDGRFSGNCRSAIFRRVAQEVPEPWKSHYDVNLY